MIEVLTALENEDDYNIFRKVVKKALTDNELKKVMDAIDRYYRYKVGTEIEWDTFATWFFVQNPSIVGDQKTSYELIFKKLQAASGSKIAADIVDTFLKRHYAERIAFLSMEVAEGKKNDLSDIQTEFDKYVHSSGEANRYESQRVTGDLEELFGTFITGTGLTWRLNALNQSLGPLRMSNLVFIAARPEVGKTTLICSEITHMAPQLPKEKRILYFTNEESGPRVKARLVSSALGIDAPTIRKDYRTHQAMYEAYMDGDPDKIEVIHDANLHINDMEYWLSQYDVGLIVIDQLRKVRGLESVEGVKRLERLFQMVRGWSDTYAPVITVGQLGDEAEGKQYPTMSHVYESRTAIQGECDAIVLLGMMEGTIPAETRFINVVKNKLPTPGDISLRHGKHELLIMPEIGRYV